MLGFKDPSAIASLKLIFLTLLISFAINLAIIPFLKRFAIRFGLLDQPDAERKLHLKAIPLSGGISIYVSLILSLAISLGISPEFWQGKLNAPYELLGYFFVAR